MNTDRVCEGLCRFVSFCASQAWLRQKAALSGHVEKPSVEKRRRLRLVLPLFPAWDSIRRWPRSLVRLNLATTDDRNAWNLCVEIFWASILGVAAAFNAAFAVRLGAQTAHVGLLSSLPALLAVLISIPAGRFLERRARRQVWVLGSLFLHRLGFLLVILVPWLPGVVNKGAALVALLVAIGAPAHFFSVGFNAMLADVIPERRRAAVFATRNIINTGILSVGMLLAGQWLDRVTFPINYQVMYGVGFLASILSSFYLIRIQVPDASVMERKTGTARSLKIRWRALHEIARAEPGFVRIVVNTLFYSLGAWAATPLYILYFVRELGAGEAWIGLHGMVANVAAIAGYALWRRLIELWGESRSLRLTVMGAGLYPLLIGLVPHLTPILFVAGLNGLIVPGVNLSHFTTLLKVCPEDRRPSFIGFYTTVMNVGAFVAPLAGVALADCFGLAPTLVGCGLFWLLGALSFRVWSVRVPDTVMDEP
ncbi:MAG: MFS transporter [Anaerolineae bacterium]|nr:MFS transporter [Anaerolineae bacterium]